MVMEVKLSEIFRYEPKVLQYRKESLLALDLKMEFVERLTKHLGLTFVENEKEEGNLCYAQNQNIRPGYRMVFSKLDVLNYLDNLLQPGIYHIESDTVFFNQSMDL